MIRRGRCRFAVLAQLLVLVLVLVLALAAGRVPQAAGSASAESDRAGPYRLQSARETAILASGLLLGAIALEIDRERAPLDSARIARLDAAGLHDLDRFATRFWSPRASDASNLLVWSLALAPLVSPLLPEGRDEPLTPITMYAETMLWTNASAQLLKACFARPRPFVYSTDPAIPEGEKLSADARRSLPSSHAANAFAAATFLGTVGADLAPDSRARGWIWAGSLTVATSTALLRVVSGEHFPSDVVAGAALGAAAGILIPLVHHEGGGSGDRPGSESPPAMLTVRFAF